MAKVITLGLQKSDVCRMATTGVLSHLLSVDNYKVLAVVTDSQGELPKLLTSVESNEFINRSIFATIAYK